MILKITISLLLSLNMSLAYSQIIPLWENTVPNSLESDEKEQTPKNQVDVDILWITHVQVPTLEVFLPSKEYATGQAVIICPGGGYYGLAYDWEGIDVARWLNGYGIAAFVLKYRLPYVKSVDVNHIAPLQDAQRACRLVRANAQEWNVDPNKVGVIGFSAGGHLASTLGTQWDRPNDFEEDEIDKLNSRPNFLALVYPVISMKDSVTSTFTRNYLLGSEPSQEMIDLYSNELHVSKNTPPTFIVHSQDDKDVLVKNSLDFYQALIAHEVPTEMHLLSKGGHGYALGRHQYPMNTWPEMFVRWLKSL